MESILEFSLEFINTSLKDDNDIDTVCVISLFLPKKTSKFDLFLISFDGIGRKFVRPAHFCSFRRNEWENCRSGHVKFICFTIFTIYVSLDHFQYKIIFLTKNRLIKMRNLATCKRYGSRKTKSMLFCVGNVCLNIFRK